MNRVSTLLLATLVCLSVWSDGRADPIHAIADGAFWHHDSGWVFPGRLEEFVLTGAAQDVAGTPDAVAHYARVSKGVRATASVDVYAADSGAPDATFESVKAGIEREIQPNGRLSSEDSFPVGKQRPFPGTRVTYSVAGGETPALIGLYLVTAGDWFVRIRVTLPRPERDARERMDAFVLAQRWDTLPGS
jgi:hypothetical protein